MEHLWNIANPATAVSGEPTTHLVLTLATAVSAGIVVFVTVFLAGLWCGWTWRHWSHDAEPVRAHEGLKWWINRKRKPLGDRDEERRIAKLDERLAALERLMAEHIEAAKREAEKQRLERLATRHCLGVLELG